MDGLFCTTITTATATAVAASACSFSVNKFYFPAKRGRVNRITSIRKRREVKFPRRNGFVVLAAKEEEQQPKLDQWDQMELKFGRLLGEDPKLTLAKIMARKANPDVSYLEVEKSFYKNKGKIVEREELPFDVSKEKKASNSLDDLNLVRPVPKKGVKFQPAMPEEKKPSQPERNAAVNSNVKSSVPNVILRKPAMFVEDDVEDKPLRSRVRIKSNLTLKMGNDRKNEKFSDMTLLRRPEVVSVDEKQETSSNLEATVSNIATEMSIGKEDQENKYIGYTILEKPKPHGPEQSAESGDSSIPTEQDLEDNFIVGMQPCGKSNARSIEPKAALDVHLDLNIGDPTVKLSVEAALQGKPKRLDQPVKKIPRDGEGKAVLVNPGSFDNVNALKDLPSTSPAEDADWTRAEHLVTTGDRAEVELISSSARGFVVAFGSLIGFLPYRNLAAKWKFVAFESWLREKGIDPSIYKQNLGIGSYDVLDQNPSRDSKIDPENDQKLDGNISPDMKLEDLLRIYDQVKLRFLASFVGQKVKVNLVTADRKLRKLIVSLRPKEREDVAEKKRTLMAKLQIGDVVKCCIKKITYFGVFVEVDGVPALIHNTEISWDATLDPASYFKIDQIVEAKVRQLDFSLERIFLSLKEIMPDPLIEALESVVGGHDALDGRLQAAEADTEWDEVESLIKELQEIEGVHSVSKGRFFLSPGLAPTFQVYMTSMFENEYKLLARSGNKVQEVIVQATLGKEEMKSTILSCTNRVG